MADITTFPTITGSIEFVNDVITFTASGDLKRGQHVAFNTAGASLTVEVADAAAHDRAAGIVTQNTEDGKAAPVKLFGPVVVMANGDDGLTLDAGTEVMIHVLGSVIESTGNTVGMIVEDIGGNSYGKVMMYKK